jgi:hypothetical protein
MAYSELNGWPKERWTDDAFTAERCLKCDWENRYDVVSEMAAEGGQVYPYRTSLKARAIGASCAGFGDMRGETSPGIGYYEFAAVTVYYSTIAPQYVSTNGVFVSEFMEPTTELIRGDYEDFCWSSNKDGTAIKPAEAPTKLIPGINYILVFHRVHQIPGAAESLTDYCNAGPCAAYTLGRVFPPETLLYRGYTASRDLGLGTLPTWKYALTFSYRPVGWNTFWRAEKGTYEYLYHAKGTGRYINHPLGNFSYLMP